MMLTLEEQAEFDSLIDEAHRHPLHGRDLGRLRELAIRQAPVSDDIPWLKVGATVLVLAGLFWYVRHRRHVRLERAALVAELV